LDELGRVKIRKSNAMHGRISDFARFHAVEQPPTPGCHAREKMLRENRVVDQCAGLAGLDFLVDALGRFG
jgi:hypothetical protein